MDQVGLEDDDVKSKERRKKHEKGNLCLISLPAWWTWVERQTIVQRGGEGESGETEEGREGCRE